MKTSLRGLAEIAGHEPDSFAAEVRRLFDYDPETGALTWRTGPARYRGKAAGTLLNTGYRSISVRGRRYVAHRLAWVHFHGKPPTKFLDHINGDRDDNRIVNLREATNAENMANAKCYATNKIGLKGVSAKRGRWRAVIVDGGRQRFLGMFDTPEEAHAAYIKAAEKRFGQFARAA